jgi:hypothetical protein
MTVFLDDVSMTECNARGDQPTLELVRQLVESNGFYFLEKDKRGDKKIVENILYVGAMSHPGGARNDIPDRLKRHFFTFNLTPPSQQSIDNIYGSMLRGRFEDHPESRILCIGHHIRDDRTVAVCQSAHVAHAIKIPLHLQRQKTPQATYMAVCHLAKVPTQLTSWNMLVFQHTCSVPHPLHRTWRN